MPKGRFSSTGIVVGQTRSSRRDQSLQHQKGAKVTMGSNAPRSGEGAIGDITVRTLTNKGFRAYIKTNSGWVDINSMTARESVEWIDINLATNISHDSAGITPRYGKDSNGFVYLRGLINIAGGTETITITTLPSGYRPPKTVYVPGCHASGVLVYKITNLGVVNAPGNTVASDVSLDGVSFFAQQSAAKGGHAGGGHAPDPGDGGHAPQ